MADKKTTEDNADTPATKGATEANEGADAKATDAKEKAKPAAKKKTAPKKAEKADDMAAEAVKDEAKADEAPATEAAEEPEAEDKPAEKPASEKSGSVSDLADLGNIAGDAPNADAAAIASSPAAPLREQELDQHGRAYATGRRKDAVARVWIKPGKGKITVNGREQEVYFARPTLRLILNQPFAITDREGQYDVVATVRGGGLSGQAGAVKHGISQALTKFEPELRSTVKAAGFLTRDSRVVERKKYGRAKARRSFQFSKR